MTYYAHMNTLRRNIAVFAAFLILILPSCSGGRPAATVAAVADVEGRTIGVLSDTVAELYASGHGEVRPYGSADAMTGDLRAGVIDCALIDEAAAESAVKRARGVRALSEPFIDAEFCVVAAKQAKDLTQDVNSALKTLKSDGTLKALVGKYTLGEEYSYAPRTDIPASAGTLRLAVREGDFAPYCRYDGGGGVAGLDIDVARAVCDLLGVNLEITPIPSSELVNAVWAGKADFAMGGMYKTPEREELVDFSNPYTTCTLIVLTRK
jgi:polar amino acid transport system substrate-binding protein